MRLRDIFLRFTACMLLAGVIALPGFAQVQVEPSHIPQQIMINGQPANGAFVPSAAGGMQTFTCPSPQHYTTPDGSVQGWACYDQRSETYLLNAIPPGTSLPFSRPASPAPLPQAPATVYGPTYPPVSYAGFGFPQSRVSGNVKIDTKLKDAMVYIDGGYAGPIRKLKRFSLTAGNHDIELRDSRGQTIFKELVQVIPGKTIEVRSIR